ncbi:Xaa-Pro dipeptidase-like [Raphidocelis subcapitata]|uniref:Xaa-Pro dipeptidase n=1 Tax=Raphidocelis subcapitata TaxID=307507 RepID=A0A2V0P331_9CHLO|nr:Xaa-Pro dipeptidase-like [Raphidocelis subcapitata]|eukprot:GBF92263.1 Xaa-Pro dipeptidase-like [Raphidocelis subcapitata]
MAAANDGPCYYSMGADTLRVCRRELHGGARAEVVRRMRDAGGARGIVLLKGGDVLPVYATDGEILFRQDAYFHYLFGVMEEGFWGAVDTRDGKATLFMPRLPESYGVWMGELHGPDYYKAKYAVDAVAYVDEMAATLKAASPPCLHVLSGTNTDSGTAVAPPPAFEGQEEAGFEFEAGALFPAITEARVHKSKAEVEVLRYANKLASRAHVAMMEIARPGKYEYQLESLFRHLTYSQGGCRNQGYTCIAASGPNAAVLHYGHAAAPNDRQLAGGDIVLLDMGCEYHRYTSDITTSFPADGKFTPDQRVVYDAVLDAHQSVIGAMKPGVAWSDMQTLAYRKILSGLKAGGILRGEVEEMLEAELGGVFMPHGLGHFLGLDTHDVGGYGEGFPERIQRPGYRSLRTARALEPGMVITVEPGCYFIKLLIQPALQDPARAKFLNAEALARFMDFGGVRLEDNVLVTERGAESLTDVPRTAADVEAVMAGAPWPPARGKRPAA